MNKNINDFELNSKKNDFNINDDDDYDHKMV